MDTKKIEENLKKDPIGVFHKELKRVEDSIYKSECPFCENGILLIKRNMEKDLILEEEDHCMSCGTRVLYLDIEDLRKIDG